MEGDQEETIESLTYQLLQTVEKNVQGFLETICFKWCSLFWFSSLRLPYHFGPELLLAF